MQVLTASALSQKALARLKKPRTRGSFAPIDAARRQLGLVAVSDSLGQARLFWLVDLTTQIIEDARFLAFGSLASHPLMDAFTELVRGRTVADAALLSVEQIDAVLRDDPLTPSCPPGAGAFIEELQRLALEVYPSVKLLPKPEEKVQYQRKRKQDWSAEDERWLPLSLLKKIAKVDAVVGEVLPNFAPGVTASIDGLHDDFRILVAFTGAEPAQVPTVVQKLSDALRGKLHPQLSVEAQTDAAEPAA
jgi:NifU-like protein involved in Fe-S cluster formation